MELLAVAESVARDINLNKDEVLSAIANRPENQSVVVTGRGAITELKDMADTVSEIKDVKHAFREGIKARQGVDWWNYY